MELNRNLQRRILERLAEAYPENTSDAWDEIKKLADEQAVFGNLFYLEEHGLLASGVTRTLSGEYIVNTSKLRITARGLDFLADDGGLSAILGVVTIKIHDDQLRDLLAARIQDSSASPEEKKRSLDLLREIPADATKHLARKLIDAGLEHWPAVLSAMQTLVK